MSPKQKLSIVAFHVDDSTIFTPADHIEFVKNELKSKFDTHDLGELNHFVGIKISRDRNNNSIMISQEQYICDIIEHAGMMDANAATTPMYPKQAYEKFSGPCPDYPYLTMVGSLMWAALCTCPDIAFAVHHFAQFNNSYGPEHISGVKRIFRYLKGTTNRGITYSKSDSGLMAVGYADADWVEQKDRKSISGNLFIMSGGAIAWSTKKQGTITLLTLEAEYTSLSHASCHVLWHQMLIWELGFNVEQPFNINNDNCGAIALTWDPQSHGQSKHIDIWHHFIWELIKRSNLKIHHVRSSENLADIFTKPLPEKLFIKFASAIIQET